MRYTTEASTDTTISASSSVTLRDNDKIEAVTLSMSLVSAVEAAQLFGVVSFNQTPPGGTAEDFTLVDQEDVIAFAELRNNGGRYWNGTAAVAFTRPAAQTLHFVLPTPIPVQFGERIFLHVFNLDGADLTSAKRAKMILHTANQVKVTRATTRR